MNKTAALDVCCDICGIPLDAQYFDESGFVSCEHLPLPGESATLASFQIPQQYCGVLECFAQFTDEFAWDNAQVHTPGLDWIILRNGQPLFPYNKLDSIVNPWGYGNYNFHIRLDENSKVEFVIRNRGCKYSNTDITKVGGRIMGRFWYNPTYGV